ncbi:MAG: hypothetical protein L0I92_09245, partial [Staphylococcus equorum]|nr:hypothetical protein [Staphylococcus equorum]
VTYKGNVVDDFYIINYSVSNDTFNITRQASERKFESLDLATVKDKLNGYVTSGLNTPPEASRHGYFESVSYGSNSRLTYSPYNSYKTYVNLNLSGVWQGWQEQSPPVEAQSSIVVSKEQPVDATVWFEVID